MVLKADEMVAFEVLNPALRSRAGSDNAGLTMLADKKFYNRRKSLFTGNPSGTIKFYSLSDAIKGINKLNKRVDKLEEMISKPHK